MEAEQPSVSSEDEARAGQIPDSKNFTSIFTNSGRSVTTLENSKIEGGKADLNRKSKKRDVTYDVLPLSADFRFDRTTPLKHVNVNNLAFV